MASREVIKNVNEFEHVDSDIDSYTVVSDTLRAIPPGNSFRIGTEEHDATYFQQKKLTRVIIHEHPEKFQCQDSMADPELYELRIGGSDNLGYCYIVLDRDSIPQYECDKFNITIDETTKNMINARKYFLNLFIEVVESMEHTMTYITNSGHVTFNGIKGIYIHQQDWGEFSAKLELLCKKKSISICFFYKAVHGIKSTISKESIQWLKSVMLATADRPLFKQIHVGMTLRGKSGSGLFIDLNKLPEYLDRPSVGVQFRTYPHISKDIGTFSGVTSLSSVSEYITSLNAYNPIYHQVKGILYPNSHLTNVLLGRENYNPLKKNYFEMFDRGVKKYLHSVEGGTSLRIEMVISEIDYNDLLDELFILHCCKEILLFFINEELLLRVNNMKGYADIIGKKYDTLKSIYGNCQTPLSKSDITKLHQAENEFWLSFGASSRGLIQCKDNMYTPINNNDPTSRYLTALNSLMIVDEFLPPSMEKRDTYKKMIISIYKFFPIVDWKSELFSHGKLEQFTDDDRLIYLVLKIYLHAADFLGILPKNEEFLEESHSICPLKYMTRGYINEQKKRMENELWCNTVDVPITVANSICKPKTSEGKLLSHFVLPAQMMDDKKFVKKIRQFIKVHNIDAFPTYFLYGCEHLTKTWTAIYVGDVLSVDTNVIEVSGQFRRQLNLRKK